jgi:hypothetical protein
MMSEYEEMMERSAEDIYLAIMDKLGVKLSGFETTVEQDREDRSWTSQAPSKTGIPRV